MSAFDTIIRGGTIVDGTGRAAFAADLAIRGDRIAAIGDLSGHDTSQVIDAGDMVVAPGIVDVHTHYDAQVHWDPYCATSSWHGVTTSIVSNCGFGFAPVVPQLQDRYMRMMQNTEQVPYASMRRALAWDWDDFISYMRMLRDKPKGINMATYLPLNSLMCYVMGADAAKSREATAQERAEMRRVLHEAMDHGAIGFSFSHLQAFNSHKDFDGSPMPSDTMAVEEAYNLADVLKERGEGVIQALLSLPGAVDNKPYAEELALRSGQPVIHNIVLSFDFMNDIHRPTLAWLDECAERGLDIYSQSFAFRAWNEFRPRDYNAWDYLPPFAEFSSCGGVREKSALARDPAWRAQVKAVYSPQAMMASGGAFEGYILRNAAGHPDWTEHEGQLLAALAAGRGQHIVDLFFDICVDTGMECHFKVPNPMCEDPDIVMEMLNHPRVLAGISDGGAHGKFYSGGQWGTDLIMWLVRETGRMSPEAMHRKLSSFPARLVGLQDRGELVEGHFADIMIYHPDTIGYDRSGYRLAYDLPGGDFRRVCDPRGIEWVIVNGKPIFRNNNCQGGTPGRLLSNHASAPQSLLAKAS